MTDSVTKSQITWRFNTCSSVKKVSNYHRTQRAEMSSVSIKIFTKDKENILLLAYLSFSNYQQLSRLSQITIINKLPLSINYQCPHRLYDANDDSVKLNCTQGDLF